ncbi:conserved hypothetical protein, partial [Neospora caninum Liverpool]
MPAFRRRLVLNKIGARVATAKTRIVQPLSHLSSFYFSVPPLTRLYCSASLLLTLLSSPTLATFLRTKVPGPAQPPSFSQGPRHPTQSPVSLARPSAEPEGLLPPEQLAMHAPRVLRAFEFWRPFTAGTFFGAPSLGTVLRIYGAYTALRHMEETVALSPGSLGSIDDPVLPRPSASRRLKPERRVLGLGRSASSAWRASRSPSSPPSRPQSETDREGHTARGLAEASSGAVAAARSAETLTFLLFQFASLSCIAGCLKLPFFASSLSSAALYHNCRTNPEAPVSLIMGIKLPQKYLPYGALAVDVLHAQALRAAVPGLLGICSGELYWFLTK